MSDLQGNAIDIPVDTALSVQQNAQVYYDKRRIVLQKVVHLQDKLANLKKQYALQNDEHFLAAKSWLIGKKE